MSGEKFPKDFEFFLERNVTFEFDDSAGYRDAIFAAAREMYKDNEPDEVLIGIMEASIELFENRLNIRFDVGTLDDMIAFEAARIVLQFREVKNIPSFLPNKRNGGEGHTTSNKIM